MVLFGTSNDNHVIAHEKAENANLTHNEESGRKNDEYNTKPRQKTREKTGRTMAAWPKVVAQHVGRATNSPCERARPREAWGIEDSNATTSQHGVFRRR